MTADLLREAASLMRDRAEAAEPDDAWWPLDDVRWALSNFADVNADVEADARHMASWRPVVAIAVAGWLEQHARAAEEAAEEDGGDNTFGYTSPQADAVALAYLGRVAQ